MKRARIVLIGGEATLKALPDYLFEIGYRTAPASSPEGCGRCSSQDAAARVITGLDWQPIGALAKPRSAGAVKVLLDRFAP